MLDAIIVWLDQIRSAVFWICATGLVVLDLGAMVVVMRTRSRALVNRWTGPVLAGNLILIGAGVGVPMAAYAAKAVASALAPSLSTVQAKGDLPAGAAPVSRGSPEP